MPTCTATRARSTLSPSSRSGEHPGRPHGANVGGVPAARHAISAERCRARDALIPLSSTQWCPRRRPAPLHRTHDDTSVKAASTAVLIDEAYVARTENCNSKHGPKHLRGADTHSTSIWSLLACLMPVPGLVAGQLTCEVCQTCGQVITSSRGSDRESLRFRACMSHRTPRASRVHACSVTTWPDTREALRLSVHAGKTHGGHCTAVASRRSPAATQPANSLVRNTGHPAAGSLLQYEAAADAALRRRRHVPSRTSLLQWSSSSRPCSGARERRSQP